MAAVQVLASASTTVVAARNEAHHGTVRNNGPNIIYLETTGAATATGGFPLNPGEAVAYSLGQHQALTAIAASADQVAPADTRVLRSGALG